MHNINKIKIQLLKKIANDVNKTSIKPNLSYSYIMRKLRKDNNKEKIKLFQKTFKKVFDEAILNNHNNFHDLALIAAIEAIDFKDE